MGNGFLEKEIRSLINKLHPKNLTPIYEFLSFDELRSKMLASHVSLGQLENHERLERTIPHKCYESIAMGLPYLTARTVPVAEILKNGESVLFVNPADPQDLAEKILYLKNNPDLAKKIGENGRKIYQERFTPKALGKEILSILQKENPLK
jgi:glycosyltransferase involved in cell wall biosynthesis